jgi:hypothetical protein
MSKCDKRGHDWFPDNGAREFVVTEDMCMRCGVFRTLLPYGRCLCGEPLAEHYNKLGGRRDVRGCSGPR